MRAVTAARAGGPEVLSYDEVPDLTAGPDEVVLEVAAAGVNFIDTYRRSGVYPTPYPHVPGTEAAGVVTAVGSAVTDVAVGDRVVTTDARGAYAQNAVAPADRVVAVPDGVPLETAAAVALQGLTAHYLAVSTFPVAAGQDLLVHAGAGGVGLLLTQIAVARGARVLTTVSTPEKAELSRQAGAAEVIDYAALGDLPTELPARVRELTGGEGVAVVYDGVGRTTFDASLASLARRGTLVLFGGSSGQVPAFDLQRLNAGGSLYVTRPSLGHYVVTRQELVARFDDLFAWIQDGNLAVRVGATYPLADAADAHRALEGRRTTGKVLLVP